MINAASIKDKVHFIQGVQYLYDYINPDQLEIPPFVMEFDVQVAFVFFLLFFFHFV